MMRKANDAVAIAIDGAVAVDKWLAMERKKDLRTAEGNMMRSPGLRVKARPSSGIITSPPVNPGFPTTSTIQRPTRLSFLSR